MTIWGWIIVIILGLAALMFLLDIFGFGLTLLVTIGAGIWNIFKKIKEKLF